MKTCTKCKRTLPLDMFLKNIHYKDGYKSACKACVSEYNREYALKHNIKKYKEVLKQRKINLLDAEWNLGGYRIYILNHHKKGEFKYNILKVQTGDVFNTNNKGEFLDYLEKYV